MQTKNAFFITITISILTILLNQLNAWHISYPISFLIIIAISFISIYIQKQIDKNTLENKPNFYNLDILKYICAVLIMILHLRPFHYSLYPDVDFALNNIITRICVPVFFMITGYFVAKKEHNDPKYINNYCKKMIPLYLIYSLAYLPILISFAYDNRLFVMSYIQQIPHFLLLPLLVVGYPLVMFIALIYSGIYYHLWYFPAVMLSLWTLSKWKKHFDMRYLLLISFILLLFGATETYYGVLPLTFTQIIDFYFKIFITTRNFLFFGLFYTVLGYYVGSKDKLYTHHCFIALIICGFLLSFEAIFLRYTDRLNSNILLSCIPFTYFLFVSTIFISQKTTKIAFAFRDHSKYYYLVHPMIIYLMIRLGVIDHYTSPYVQILLIWVCTHILSLILAKIKKHHRDWPI
ncbi:MAG: acyltransferase [Erysipelotrichaceae bacterium]|nr:acyltransferase [Erysipelotrichaceae bacterium]MDY5252382.1 acyltransferase family protein [Erysipelotrichaceae bacterium]